MTDEQKRILTSIKELLTKVGNNEQLTDEEIQGATAFTISIDMMKEGRL